MDVELRSEVQELRDMMERIREAIAQDGGAGQYPLPSAEDAPRLRENYIKQQTQELLREIGYVVADQMRRKPGVPCVNVSTPNDKELADAVLAELTKKGFAVVQVRGDATRRHPHFQESKGGAGNGWRIEWGTKIEAPKPTEPTGF